MKRSEAAAQEWMGARKRKKLNDYQLARNRAYVCTLDDERAPERYSTQSLWRKRDRHDCNSSRRRYIQISPCAVQQARSSPAREYIVHAYVQHTKVYIARESVYKRPVLQRASRPIILTYTLELGSHIQTHTRRRACIFAPICALQKSHGVYVYTPAARNIGIFRIVRLSPSTRASGLCGSGSSSSRVWKDLCCREI